MRKNIFFSVLLFLSILILLLFPLTVGAAEVVDKIARFTGLSSDLTQLVLESEPELLGKLNKTVFGVQVLNQLLEAKDTEAMRSIFNLAVSNLTDYLMKQAVHPAIGTFLTVVKAYKNSLELVRDYIVIPNLIMIPMNAIKKPGVEFWIIVMQIPLRLLNRLPLPPSAGTIY